jgi:hypothetical protein
MNSSGLALINIDESPINLAYLPIRQRIFENSSDFYNLILENYANGLKKNIFKLIGSTSILGNPRKFVRTMK